MKEFKLKTTEEYKKKQKWLTDKWMPPEPKPPDTLRGIILKDQTLTEEFSSKPRIYGDAEVSEQELELLNLPPEYGIYKKVDVRDATIETERALNKLRWKEIIGDQQEETGERPMVTHDVSGNRRGGQTLEN